MNPHKFIPLFISLLLYQNVSAQFVEQTSIVLPGIAGATVVPGDYDNDSDLDILLCGISQSGPISKLFKNNGDNSFTEQTQISLPGVYSGDASWGDYDNDGDLDLILTGELSPTEYLSRIYRNNGDNTFDWMNSITLPGVSWGSAAFGDYDNDGDLDLVLAGRKYTGIPVEDFITTIYTNTGISFTPAVQLPGIMDGIVKWGDYDNDSDLDLLVTGNLGGSMNYTAKIYRNENGLFVEQSIPLPQVTSSTADWGDYDNDGDLDIIIAGFAGPECISKVYRNNGNNTFTEQSSIVVEALQGGSVLWGDYDNDGNLDFLITGMNSIGTEYKAKVYRNNGNNTFTEQPDIILPGIYGSAVWWDYDNDNDLDIILSGSTAAGSITKIFRNMTTVPNTLPSIPENLIPGLYDNNTIILTWNKSTDSQTPQNGLKYNLAMGCDPSGVQVVSPMSNTVTGYRKVVAMGNTNHKNSRILKSFTNRRYYWKVQAQDNTFAASDFSDEYGFAVIEYYLTNGWNMISVPGAHPNGMNPLTWFPGKDPSAGVFTFSGGYQQVTSLQPGKAYWIKHIGSATYKILVKIVPNDPIPCTGGWNLIGVYDYTVPSSNLTTTPAGLTTGSIYTFINGYVTANALYPGKGYWVKFTGAGLLNIPDYEETGCNP